MENIFGKWRQGLEKTSRATFGRIATVFGATEIDDETWEELETILVQSDLGVETTDDIIKAMRKRADDEFIIFTRDLQKTLRDELIKRLDLPPPLNLDGQK